MIGFVQGLIETLIVAPQSSSDLDDDRRVYLDPEAAPIDAAPQEVDVRPVRTVPLTYEIGGGMQVRHTVSVAVDVQHGDPLESRRRRDLIILDLCLRTLDVRSAIYSAVDPESGQYPTGIEWTVDYRPLGTSDTNESAVVTFDVTVEIDR